MMYKLHNSEQRHQSQKTPKQKQQQNQSTDVRDTNYQDKQADNWQ